MTTPRRDPNDYLLLVYWGATSPHLIGYWPARELLIGFLEMWRIGSTLKAIIHYTTFWARFCSNRLRQPINCGNDLLQQLNMVFNRLNIFSRVAWIRITVSLTFGKKNICGQLKLPVRCSDVFDIAWCTICHKDVRIGSRIFCRGTVCRKKKPNLT